MGNVFKAANVVMFAAGVEDSCFDYTIYFLVCADIIVQTFVAFYINNAFVQVGCGIFDK